MDVVRSGKDVSKSVHRVVGMPDSTENSYTVEAERTTDSAAVNGDATKGEDFRATRQCEDGNKGTQGDGRNVPGFGYGREHRTEEQAIVPIQRRAQHGEIVDSPAMQDASIVWADRMRVLGCQCHIALVEPSHGELVGKVMMGVQDDAFTLRAGETSKPSSHAGAIPRRLAQVVVG